MALDSVKSDLEVAFPKVRKHLKYLSILNYDVGFCKENVSVRSLKPGQLRALSQCEEMDCIVTLPTGYGKSLIFEMLPYITGTPIIVASPLDSIIIEQLARLGPCALHVNVTIEQQINRYLNKTSGDIQSEATHEDECFDVEVVAKDLLGGKIKYLVGHPERLTSNVFMTFLQSVKGLNISHIVVDEAHCILTWGESKFRPAFLALKSLRPLLPMMKVLALTATANAKGIKAISEALLMKNFATVSQLPDRRNVFLDVYPRLPSSGGKNTAAESYEAVLKPLLEQLEAEKNLFPKTIVYLPLQWCGLGHDLATRIIGLERGPVAQYHSPQSTKEKMVIVQEMRKPDSRIRLLFATEAYGMGTDAPDIRRIIHIGPPSSIETYMQEIGRSGRDGAPASARIYFNKSDVGANKEHLEESMRDYCNLLTCRRKFLMNYLDFDLNENDISPVHFCCDNCRKICTCTDCSDIRSWEMDVGDLPPGPSVIAIQTCEDMLLKYFSMENSLIMNSSTPDAVTGLSISLAKNIAVNLCNFVDFETMQNAFPEINLPYLENVNNIVQKVRDLLV